MAKTVVIDSRGLLDRSIIAVDFSFTDQLTETLCFVRRYHDTPMSFADACLVRMTEQIHDAVIFTTDSDFRTYRKNGRQVIPLHHTRVKLLFRSNWPAYCTKLQTVLP
jgi:hypothetical protein